MWWINKNGYIEGPFSSEQIEKRVKLNLLRSLDRVSEDRIKWIYVKDSVFWNSTRTIGDASLQVQHVVSQENRVQSDSSVPILARPASFGFGSAHSATSGRFHPGVPAEKSSVNKGLWIAFAVCFFALVLSVSQTLYFVQSSNAEISKSSSSDKQETRSENQISIPEISSGEYMSPDQEVFNAVYYFAEELKQNPSQWEKYSDNVREYSQSNLKSDTKALVADFLQLCENVGKVTRQIEYRENVGNDNASNAAVNGAIEGARQGAGLGLVVAHGLNQISQENGGKGIGTSCYVLSAIVGAMINGFYNANREKEESENRKNYDIEEMKRRMEVLVKDFQVCLDEFQSGSTFSTFDRRRVLSSDNFTAGDSFSMAKSTQLQSFKVPEIINDLIWKASFTGETEILKALCIARIQEWPSSRKRNSSDLAFAYFILAYDAYRNGENERSIALANEGLSLGDDGFGCLYVVRGLAKLHSKDSNGAKSDIETAIKKDPKNAAFEIALAQVLCAGFHDRAGTLSAIHRAKDKGFRDLGNIQNEPDFSEMKNDAVFIKLTTANVD